jgi:hypothetical protein
MSDPKLVNSHMVLSDTCSSAHQLIEWASKLPPPRSEKTNGYFSGLWFRGYSKSSYDLIPGVYRNAFTAKANDLWIDRKHFDILHDELKSKSDAEFERKRLNLERLVVRDLLQAGGHLLRPKTTADAYFLAQHFGAPTRLLDWSTNPLVALYMAVANDDGKPDQPPDGAVLAMDPTAHLPKNEQPFRAIMTPDHPYAKDAIEVVMNWANPNSEYRCHILPIRPNTQAGRIERQASCFTLHSYGSEETQNPTLRRCLIPWSKKSEIRTVLSSLSINQFTVYNTLDRLSSEIRTTWNIREA